ncbi:hypothetical protein [Arthrobacter sp. SD76]|uniref:hypothetical protein n=1 Tax=Arthrobacter sp. SD76 TaxID=3415007 RepID=UPI003C78F33A
MSVSVTVSRPGRMTVSPSHVIRDRTMVNLSEEDNKVADPITFWVSPDVAAQWIKALTPLAEGKL